MRKFLPVMLLVPLAILLAQPRPSTQPKSTWNDVERIVAVGDVHGDADKLVAVLREAKLIDDKQDWIGGKSHLVQTGDVLDRGPDSRQAMDLLMKLEEQAAKAGGAVHALIGNHEAMVLAGQYHYMTDDEKESYGGTSGLRKQFAINGKYGRWIRSHNAVVQINDVLFVHGGLGPEMIAKYKTLDALNAAVRKQLIEGRDGGPATDTNGPMWNRTFSIRARDSNTAPELLTVLRACKASRMVVGHTIVDRQITTGLDDKLIMIDVGMSSYYDGEPAGLLIEDGRYYELRPGQEKRLLLKTTPPAGSQPAEAEKSQSTDATQK